MITSQTRTPCSDKWLLVMHFPIWLSREAAGGPKTREIGDMMARPASQRSAANKPSHPNPDDKRSLDLSPPTQYAPIANKGSTRYDGISLLPQTRCLPHAPHSVLVSTTMASLSPPPPPATAAGAQRPGRACAVPPHFDVPTMARVGGLAQLAATLRQPLAVVADDAGHRGSPWPVHAPSLLESLGERGVGSGKIWRWRFVADGGRWTDGLGGGADGMAVKKGTGGWSAAGLTADGERPGDGDDGDEEQVLFPVIDGWHPFLGWTGTRGQDKVWLLSLSFDPSFNAVSDLLGGGRGDPRQPGNLDATARWDRKRQAR